MKGCQEITEQIEKGKISGNSMKEKIEIRLHLLICKLCRSYVHDSAILDRALRNKFKKQKEYRFSAVEKDLMKVKLKG